MVKNNNSNINVNYDTIIVGAGPAGSTAAYLLAKSGIKSLLIDKSNFPRYKLCGGLLSNKTINLLEIIYGETEKSLTKKGIIKYTPHYYKFFYKTKLIIDKETKDNLFFINREDYDYFLLNKVREAGSEILLGETVEDIDPNSHAIITSKGKKIHGKLIIGADGANSIIRRKAFSSETDPSIKGIKNLAIALQIDLPLNQIRKGTVIDSLTNSTSLFFDFIRYGYSWVFPNKTFLKIGIGGLQSKNKSSIFSLFSKFLSFLGVDSFFINDAKGAPVPLGNYLSKPIKDSVILIGDAAGCVDPLTGEGIYYAHKSAELAARAICNSFRDNASLEYLYLNELHKYIFSEIDWALKLRDLIFEKTKIIPINYTIKYLKKYDYILLDLVSGKISYSDVFNRLKMESPLWKTVFMR